MKLDFTKILNSEFRWPKSGDRPFQEAEEWHNNAYLEDIDIHARTVLMTEGYKKGAELMVAHAVDSRGERGFLVYAIIFNYRQFLELSLKSMIAYYGPSVGVEPNWRSHDLTYLWNLFVRTLDGYSCPDPDGTNEIVKSVVVEFAKIDPGSYSYRYPTDTEGNPVTFQFTAVDLDRLRDVIDGVAGFFSGCDGYLSSLRDVMPDFP